MNEWQHRSTQPQRPDVDMAVGWRFPEAPAVAFGAHAGSIPSTQTVAPRSLNVRTNSSRCQRRVIDPQFSAGCSYKKEIVAIRRIGFVRAWSLPRPGGTLRFCGTCTERRRRCTGGVRDPTTYVNTSDALRGGDLCQRRVQLTPHTSFPPGLNTNATSARTPHGRVPAASGLDERGRGRLAELSLSRRFDTCRPSAPERLRPFLLSGTWPSSVRLVPKLTSPGRNALGTVRCLSPAHLGRISA